MLFSINREDAEVSDLCPSFDYDECTLYNLQYEIHYFNSIIKWDGMWDLPKAKIRLDNGWKFVVFNPQSIIQGWGWLNTETREICNIYVNPKYRNKIIVNNFRNFKRISIRKKKRELKVLFFSDTLMDYKSVIKYLDQLKKEMFL